MHHHGIAALFVLSLGWASTARADWPQMRGPTGQGHSSAAKLPLRWSATEAVAWKTDIPGKGWSTPTVAGGFVYVTTAVPQGEGKTADQSLELVKLDAKTGQIVKQQRIFLQNGQTAPPIHAKNSHASPTPIHENGRVYVHFGHQGTACVKAEDLSIVWSRILDYKPQHGNGGSPLLDGDRLFISIDGLDRRSCVALDKTTGRILWETKRSRPAKMPFSFGTPVKLEVAGTPMIVTTSSDALYGYDPRTGKELWSLDYVGYSVVPVPLVAHGMIYISTGYNTPSLLAVKVDKIGNKFTPEIVWRHKVDVPHNPSPVIVGDELYMVSDGGIATCLDAKSGQVHWRERLTGAYSASLLHGGGHIYCLSEQGVCSILKPGKTFELVGTCAIGGRTLASLAVDGDALLLRTEQALFRIQGP